MSGGPLNGGGPEYVWAQLVSSNFSGDCFFNRYAVMGCNRAFTVAPLPNKGLSHADCARESPLASGYHYSRLDEISIHGMTLAMLTPPVKSDAHRHRTRIQLASLI